MEPTLQDAFPDLKLLSYHMPKTAGSSFLKALRESDWGDGVCVIDQLDLSACRARLRELETPVDRYRFMQETWRELIPRNTRIIHGHLLFHSYLSRPLIDAVPQAFKVVWLRAPEQRALSTYNFVRQTWLRNGPQEWTGARWLEAMFRDPVEACTHPSMVNFQANEMRHFELDEFDFIGFTEQFEEDLDQLQSHLGPIGLRSHVVNTSATVRPLNPGELQAIREANDLDVALYNRARSLRGLPPLQALRFKN